VLEWHHLKCSGFNVKRSIFILTTALAFPLLVSGAEIDAFSKRFEPLEDSLQQVNAITKQLFDESLVEANEKEDGCDEDRLYKSLRKRFNNQYQGELPKILINSEDIPKIHIPSKESIYQDFKWYEAIVQGGTARISDPIASQMKVGNILIGTDKFEHFLGSGYHYFNKFYLDGETVEDALNIGWKAETGILGAFTTGVMSYADLTANFNGMRFWNHILLKNDDILGAQYNQGPFVKCEENKWVATEHTIDWSKYIDHAFDEGINCSRFKNESLAKKVSARLLLLESEDKEGRKYTCPMAPQKLEALKSKYGQLAPYLLNPYGHNPIGEESFDSLYPAP